MILVFFSLFIFVFYLATQSYFEKTSRFISQFSPDFDYSYPSIIDQKRNNQTISDRKDTISVNDPSHGVILPRDGVNNQWAVSVNMKLLENRDKAMGYYVDRNCRRVEFEEVCKYSNTTQHILEKNNTSELLKRFISLQYISNKRVCDGCLWNRNITLKHKSLVDGELIRKFVGGIEVDDIYTMSNPYYPPSYQQHDVTAIFALYGMNRLFTLRELLLRFKGNVMLVIKEKAQAESRLLKYIQSHYLPSRLTIILYLVDRNHPQYNRFPVNYLRSLGISNVRTSHYIVLDIDLHPSMNVYYELTHLPQSIYENNRSAVILPIFFFNNLLQYCDSVQSCAHLSSAIQPRNKQELILCVHDGICSSDKNGYRMHFYVMPEWYWTQCRVSRIKCFITDMMEPYVMVKHTPQTPTYDVRFGDYGFNKISFIEELREMNFQMYILNNAFALDYPHPISPFKIKYKNRTDIENTRKLFSTFLEELDVKYAHSEHFPICKEVKYQYYEEICS